MLVRDALLSNPLIVSPDTSALEFCLAVLDSNQTTAVVIDDARRLLGVVSVRDVFGRIIPHYVNMDDKLASVIHEGYFDEKFTEFQHLPVKEIMTLDVDLIAPHDSVIKAVAMLRHRKTIPVIDDGQFLGTITRRSVLTAVTGR